MRFAAQRLHRVMVSLRLCRQERMAYDLGGPSAIKIAIPGVGTADTERRRYDSVFFFPFCSLAVKDWKAV